MGSPRPTARITSQIDAITRAAEQRLASSVALAARGAALHKRDQIRSVLARELRLGSHGLPRRLSAAIAADLTGAQVGVLNPRARVASYAGLARLAAEIDLIEVLRRGAEISAGRSRYLAIPTQDAPTIGNRVATCREAIQQLGLKLQFIASAGGETGVMIERKAHERRGIVRYVLVRRLRIAAKIDIDALLDDVTDLRRRLVRLLGGA